MSTRLASPDDTFTAFYYATAHRTFRALCRMTDGDQDLARDAMQDGYLIVMERWCTREHLPHDVNRKYVVGIAAHKVADWYRSQRRFVELDGDADEIVIDDDLAEKLDANEALVAVRELIKCQPDRRRAVVVMFFVDGIGYAEIAQSLGMAESTVRTHVERFRRQLKPLADKFTQTDRGGDCP